MGIVAIRLPDIGEGIAEAELMEVHVKVGDLLAEGDPIADVMTDKATVEVPSSKAGRVVWVAGGVGDSLAIGSDLVRMEVEGEGADVAPDTAAEVPGAEPEPRPPEGAPVPEAVPEPPRTAAPARAAQRARAPHRPVTDPSERPAGRPLAAPAVRRAALERGIDLRLVPGSGPAGRVLHEDLDAYRPGAGHAPDRRRTGTETRPVRGLRRRIAQAMEAAMRAPHITYVEEVDVTDLEALRAKLNADADPEAPRLTLLPFLARAIARAVAEQPHLNAHYDDDADELHLHAAVHVGIAAQTEAGLVVPVLRHAEALSLREAAAEIARLAEAARTGRAAREELTGSTITITSLGKLGGIVSTPILNRPEVAIVGTNKIATRPLWDGQAFRPRQVMNLSSSFDHRIVDGHDAAVFVQRLKALLEMPALLFVEDA